MKCIGGVSSSSCLPMMLNMGKDGLDGFIAIIREGLHFIPFSYLLIMLFVFLQRPFLLYCRHPQKHLQITSNVAVNQIGALEVLQ